MLAAPELNQRLAILYAKAQQKVEAAMKRRKSSAKDANLLNQFKGELPPSLLKIMAGETGDIGFHPIAMQIGITANAIGMRLDKVLPLCEGLIQNHKSDGNRYNTPAKRRAEIERMYNYTHDNVSHYTRLANAPMDGVGRGVVGIVCEGNDYYGQLPTAPGRLS